jgi:hypothetical protein
MQDSDELVRAFNLASHGNLAELRPLIDDRRVAVDVVRSDGIFKGYTLLHAAASKGHGEVVEFLLSKGASQDVLNPQGKTALALARDKNHLAIVAIFEKASRTSANPRDAVPQPTTAEAVPAAIAAPAPLEATSSPPTPAPRGTFTFGPPPAPAPTPTAPAPPERASTTANLPNGNSTGAASTTASPRDAVPPPSTTVAEEARVATAAPATQESTSSPLAPTRAPQPPPSQPPPEGGTELSRRLDALRADGWQRVDVVGDGNCFFRALAKQVYGDEQEQEHGRARQETIRYMREHREEFKQFVHIYSDVNYKDFDSYVDNMSREGTYVEGEIELRAAANTFNVRIRVYGRSEDHDRTFAPLKSNDETRDVCMAHDQAAQHYFVLERMRLEPIARGGLPRQEAQVSPTSTPQSATANGMSHAGVAEKVKVARRARDELDAAVKKHQAAEQSLANALIAERTAPACDVAMAARVAAEQSLAKDAAAAKDAASKKFGEATVALEPNWDFEKPLMLTEGTMVLLDTLWLILDKTGDGKISKEDFLPFAGHFKHLDTQGGDGGGKGGEGKTAPPPFGAAAAAPFGLAPHPFGAAAAAAPFGTAKWQEMSEHFDTDDSGDITPVEFIDGFKKIAMGSALDWEGIKSMPEQTYLDVQAKINKSVNRRLQNLVKEAHEKFAQDAVPPTVIKSSDLWTTNGWIQVSKRSADQLLINTENKLQIKEIFNHLDQTKDGVLGVLTKEDFGPRTPGEVSLRESKGPLPFGRRPPHPALRS